MSVLIDIVCVVLWCFAVYVCVFDWEDVRDAEARRELCGRRQEKGK